MNKVQHKINMMVGHKTRRSGKEEFKSNCFKAESMGVEPPGCCKKNINMNCPDCFNKARLQSNNEVFEHQYNERGEYWDIWYSFLWPPEESFMNNRRKNCGNA